MSTCRAYQIMIDHELDFADNCQTDSECTEVIYEPEMAVQLMTGSLRPPSTPLISTILSTKPISRAATLTSEPLENARSTVRRFVTWAPAAGPTKPRRSAP